MFYGDDLVKKISGAVDSVQATETEPHEDDDSYVVADCATKLIAPVRDRELQKKKKKGVITHSQVESMGVLDVKDVAEFF